MSPGVLNRQSELILIFEKENSISRKFTKSNFDRGTLGDIWNISRGRKIDKSHSAVFPEKLVSTILLNFSNEGDIVYDPFMGSGTTGVVSQKLNRKWIGSELSPKYCELIQKRIEEVQGGLF
jgi:site-specific DNA-methyltransferase (adenine-specific)/modification methylase